MTDLNGSKPDNVIDLRGRKRDKKTSTLDRRRGPKKGAKKQNPKGKATLWQYVQLVMVFALMAYLMQRCGM